MKFMKMFAFKGLGQMGNAAGVRVVLRVVVFLFLGLNLWYRFSTVFDYSRFVGGLFVGLAALSLLVILFPRLLKGFLFLFGFSFFMFGFRAYDIQSQVFETVVVFVAVTLFIRRLRRLNGLKEKEKGGEHGAPRLNTPNGTSGSTGQGLDGKGWGGVNPSTICRSYGVNRQLLGLILCYIVLSVFSLLLLPLGHIVKDIWLFGLKTSFLQVANATPNSCLYPLAGINRLILFFMLAYGLATSVNPRENYRWIFVGLFVGGVFCVFVGLLDYYGFISLRWYRFGTTGTAGALHSTFLNRSWLAEFILMMAPFVLIGFMSKIKGVWWKVLLLGSLVLCEIALILGGARGGWVSYPFILFVCWLFFYFTKGGRLESFHFRWKSVIKIAVSVPITIVISFLLIFWVFMPLSDYLKEQKPSKSLGVSSKSSAQYIKRQTARIVEPSGRVKAWTQGLDVGREGPWFGMGYEAFCWHANILSGIQDSIYTINQDNKHKRVLDTPHNIYFQLFVSGGIVGLCLWALVVAYSLMILVVDLIRNKRLLNVPVIISIISFHTYGLFQSMQYIPMIWMFIFLALGYTMTIDDKVLPERIRRLAGFAVKVMVCLVLIGGVVYFMGRGSQGLAEKYGLEVYAKDQDWHDYHGFYHREKWGKEYYRWSGPQASVKVSDQIRRLPQYDLPDLRGRRRLEGLTEAGTKDRGRRTEGGGVVEFDFVCSTPGVEEKPVTLTVSLDGEQIDEIVFRMKGGVKRWYYLRGERQGAEDDPHPRGIRSAVTGEFHGAGITKIREKEERGQGSPRLNTLGGNPVQRGKHEFLFDMSRTWNPKKLGISADVRDLGIAVSEPRFMIKLPKDGVGFYKWEIWGGGEIPGWPEGKEKRFRWTMGRASESIADCAPVEHPAGTRFNGVKIVMFLKCGHPGIGKEPVVVKILGDGDLLREIEFKGHGWKRVVFSGDELKGKEVLTFEVSRTWNPKRMGVSGDSRDLGVAVGVP